MTERQKGEAGQTTGRERLDFASGAEDWSAGAIAPVTDLASLEAAADAFGGDLAFWPAARREEAQALMAENAPTEADGREVLATAARLDAMLAREAEASLRQSTPSEALQARLFADALASLDAPSKARDRRRENWRSFVEGAAHMLGQLADRLGEQISPDRGLTLGPSGIGVRSLGGFGAVAVAGLVFGLLDPLSLSTSGTSAGVGGAETAYEEAIDGEDVFDLFASSRDPDGAFGQFDALDEELDG